MEDKKNLSQQQSERQANKKSLHYSPSQKAFKCPHCGASVSEHSELCPICMHPLRMNFCSFCGAGLMPEDKFCPECGNSTKGVVCKKCGTVNFRNFCYKCHEPLTEQAFAEVKNAQQDPKFQKMKEAAKSLASLEKMLLNSDDETDENELSEEDVALIRYYQNLTINLNDTEQKQQEEKTSDKSDDPVQNLSRKEVLNQYKQKVKEINEILKEFAPSPDISPQMQRDYYSARKIPVMFMTKQKVKSGWVCNYCGCFHNVPEECVEPWRGGTWQYTEIDVQNEKWVNDI